MSAWMNRMVGVTFANTLRLSGSHWGNFSAIMQLTVVNNLRIYLALKLPVGISIAVVHSSWIGDSGQVLWLKANSFHACWKSLLKGEIAKWHIFAIIWNCIALVYPKLH